jgi:hypothetical protein
MKITEWTKMNLQGPINHPCQEASALFCFFSQGLRQINDKLIHTKAIINSGVQNQVLESKNCAVIE